MNLKLGLTRSQLLLLFDLSCCFFEVFGDSAKKRQRNIIREKIVFEQEQFQKKIGLCKNKVDY